MSVGCPTLSGADNPCLLTSVPERIRRSPRCTSWQGRRQHDDGAEIRVGSQVTRGADEVVRSSRSRRYRACCGCAGSGASHQPELWHGRLRAGSRPDDAGVLLGPLHQLRAQLGHLAQALDRGTALPVGSGEVEVGVGEEQVD